MFFHNFKYAFKTLIKNRMLIFWTFMFPIILGTFFYMAFSNIEDSEKLEVFNIGIINNQAYKNSGMLKETINTLSQKGDNQLFNSYYVSEDEAKKLLDEDSIVGYIKIEDKPTIYVKKSGINETILKTVVDEVMHTKNLINDVQKYQAQDLYQNILNKLSIKSNINDISPNNISYTMIEYYTLIAMACLYGGILGMYAINQTLANMSNTGKRIAISPASKKSLILSSTLAGYTTQLIGISLLFLYTIFILKVDYGSNLLLVILMILVGSLAGLSIGVVVASIIKSNEGAKTGIVIAYTMLGCFFSGMMGITMKYIIDKNVGIINKLNPASMITDGFYALYYYDTLERFWFNIISLLIFSTGLIGLSIIALRRQKYEHI